MKARARTKSGRFTKRKKARRARRRRGRAVIIATNPRRRRVRRRRRSRSITALPRTNPRRRRRRGIRRRRNPNPIGVKQLLLGGLAAGASFAAVTIGAPRIIPPELTQRQWVYGLALAALGLGIAYGLRRHPVIALGAGGPPMGAGLLLAGTSLLAPKGQQPAAQQQPAMQGADLGAVLLEDMGAVAWYGDGMGAVHMRQPGMGAVRELGNGVGMYSRYRDMGAVEAMIGDAGFANYNAPSMADYVGAY
jgi:hypothetical protein